MVSSKPFQEFTSYLCHQTNVDLPSADTLTRRLPNMYNELRACIFSEIKTSPHRIAIVTNGWSSRNMKGFLRFWHVTL
jgi:hypothetical protein